MSHGRCEPEAGSDQRALVLGATSLVAEPLLSRLVSEDLRVAAVSRTPLVGERPPAGVDWQEGDLEDGWSPEEDAALAFHLAPLWLLPPLVAPLARRGLRRLVAFGSTSVSTRSRSSSGADRELAARLARAEVALATAARENGVLWTLLRPTLIYGGRRDRTVGAMTTFARRFGFIPVAGQAHGLRQPVRAADLAEACLAVLHCPATYGCAYDLPGGETLTFREMAERISIAALGRRSVVGLPPAVLRGLIRLASGFPSLSHLAPEMADRMNDDLVFDPSEARRDFGWDPAPFDPLIGARGC